MIKEDYLKVKERNELDVVVCYNYWIDNKKEGYADLDFDNFANLFNMFLQSVPEGMPIPAPDKSVKAINYERMKEKMFEHFDKKFNI